MLRLSGQPTMRASDATAAILKFRKGEIIYAQGDRVTDWYRVVSGTVRTCIIYPDGHRQLTGFYYSGDVFGVDRERHASSAEAVTAVALTVYRADSAATAPRSEADSRSGMLHSALNNAHACISLLGRRTANERVAAFLLATARRMGGRGALTLPMSRIDIADHLGLTIHTVSRTLSEFSRRGLITLDGPQTIEILDLDSLSGLADSHDADQPHPSCFAPRNLATANGA